MRDGTITTSAATSRSANLVVAAAEQPDGGAEMSAGKACDVFGCTPGWASDNQPYIGLGGQHGRHGPHQDVEPFLVLVPRDADQQWRIDDVQRRGQPRCAGRSFGILAFHAIAHGG